MRMKNPFKFGKEVAGAQFYDRADASEKLYRRLAGGSSNVVMYAPRRYGKTSLVNKVLQRFRDEGTPTISFDMNRIESIERFCEQYSSALCSLVGRGSAWLDHVSTYLSHLHPTFSFGGELPVAVKLDYGVRMTSVSLSAVLDLAEKTAVEKLKRPIVVAFDEFQEIDRLSSELPLEGIFRSCIQAHSSVRYVFFGSKTHLMKRMFGDKSRPFYQSASTLRLEKPPEDESAEFVRSRFASANIGVDVGVAERIVRESANIPYYLQELAAFAFETVTSEGRDWVENADVDAGRAELLDENADYYNERVAGLSISQRMLVAALAAEPTALFDESYRVRHGLGGSSSVHSALRVVCDAGLVERDGETYCLGDPFFALHLQRSAVSVSCGGKCDDL